MNYFNILALYFYFYFYFLKHLILLSFPSGRHLTIYTFQFWAPNPTYLWFGPRPVVVIMDPNLIKAVTQKVDVFRKLRVNPLGRLLAQGLVSHEGEKWAKQRKLLNPAFHVEKLKVLFSLI